MDRYPPAREMLGTVWANEILTEELAAMAVIDADIDAHLVVSNAVFTPDTVWADLTIASYPGYVTKTAAVATFTIRQTEDDGARRVQSTVLMTFAEPASGDPVTIYGIAYTEGGAVTTLYRLHRFTVPIVMSVGGGVLNHIPTITERAGSN